MSLPAKIDKMEPVEPRIRFALERTLLSWIRTSIALMGFGFLVARFSYPMNGAKPSSQFSLWIGVALILTGVAVNFTANYSFNQNLKHLQKGEPIENPNWSIGKVLSLIISLLSLSMAVHLVLQH